MIVVLLVAVLTTLVSAAAVRPLLLHLRVIDIPSERSSHSAAVVRGGGTACMAGAVVSIVAESPSALVLLSVPLAMGLIGFVDDLRSLPPFGRLVLQAAGAVSALAVVAVETNPAPITAVVGMLFFVSFVNAFNFMDGINGISGFSSLVAGLWFWSVGDHLGSDNVVVLGATLTGVSLGFLPWNVPRAYLFLGDSGSYFLGALIAVGVWLVAIDGSVEEAIAPTIVYLADTGWTLLKRARTDIRSLATPHREHAYQQLADRWGHVAAAAYAATCSAVVCLLVWWLDSSLALILAALVAVIFVSTPSALRSTVR